MKYPRLNTLFYLRHSVPEYQWTVEYYGNGVLSSSTVPFNAASTIPPFPKLIDAIDSSQSPQSIPLVICIPIPIVFVQLPGRNSTQRRRSSRAFTMQFSTGLCPVSLNINAWETRCLGARFQYRIASPEATRDRSRVARK